MHQIEKWVFTSRKTLRGMQEEADKYCRKYGDYHHACDPISFHPNIIMASYEEADKWIDDHDKGFYDCLAVKFKDGKKVKWLVKFEFHV